MMAMFFILFLIDKLCMMTKAVHDRADATIFVDTFACSLRGEEELRCMGIDSEACELEDGGCWLICLQLLIYTEQLRYHGSVCFAIAFGSVAFLSTSYLAKWHTVLELANYFPGSFLGDPELRTWMQGCTPAYLSHIDMLCCVELLQVCFIELSVSQRNVNRLRSVMLHDWLKRRVDGRNKNSKVGTNKKILQLEKCIFAQKYLVTR